MRNAEHYPDPTAGQAIGNINRQDKLLKYLNEQIEIRRLKCIRAIQRPEFRDKQHVDKWLDNMQMVAEGEG